MHFFKTILAKPLFKATSLNAVSVALKIAIGLVTSKIIAIFVGPSGMALTGNLRNFMASLETVGTLGFQNGIVKYTAENKDDDSELRKILSTIFISLAAVASVLSSLLFFLADLWNDAVFGKANDYAVLFKVLAAAMPWYIASLILISVINGLGRFREVVYVNIIGNIMGLILSVILIWQFHTFGALLSIIISPAAMFFAAIGFMPKEFQVWKYLDRKVFSLKIVKKLSSFSLMALVSAVISPLVFVVIRNHIIAVSGIANAGYWEAMSRISGFYMLFIATIVSVYYLPKLASAKTDGDTRYTIFSYWKYIIPLFSVGLIVLYFLRHFAINIILTKAFQPVESLFFWQLAGDLLKAFTVILGYALVAKRYTVAFIVTEFISMGIMYFGTGLFVAKYGIEGVVMAHFLTYLVYAAILLVFFRKVLFRTAN